MANFIKIQKLFCLKSDKIMRHEYLPIARYLVISVILEEKAAQQWTSVS